MASTYVAGMPHLGTVTSVCLASVGHIITGIDADFGLTYKPGIDTLRRSAALATASWLKGERERVQAFDPQIRKRSMARFLLGTGDTD